MEEYKDSGNTWIRNIPNDWDIIRINDIKNKKSFYPIGDGDHGSISPDEYFS